MSSYCYRIRNIVGYGSSSFVSLVGCGFFLSLGDAQYGMHVDSQLEMCSTVVNIHFIISTFCESDSCCLKILDLRGGKFLSVVF